MSANQANSGLLHKLLRLDEVTLTGRLLLAIAAITGAKLLQEWYELEQWPTVVLAGLGLGALWAGVRFVRLAQQWLVWLLLAVGVAGFIVYEWPGSANHAYVYVYLCLIMLVVLLNPVELRTRLLRQNFGYLFIIIMVLAVVQKAITPGYLDGTINAFWLSTGGYGKPLYAFASDWSATVQRNLDVLNVYYNQQPHAVHEIVLEEPVAHLRQWGFWLGVSILVAELIVPAVYVFGTSEKWRHLVLLTFVIGTFLMRQETGFLSLVSTMGLATCPADYPRMRLFYLVLIAIMQVLFVFDYGYI